MKPIPDTVRVASQDVPVKCTPDVVFKQDTPALCRNWSLEIEVDSNSVLSVQWRMVIHEVLEMIKSMNNLTLEHTELSVLGVGIFQFMVENGFLEGKLK